MIKPPTHWTIWIVSCLAALPSRFTSAANLETHEPVNLVGRMVTSANSSTVDQPQSPPNRFTPLPARPLFDDLLADPRWPRLSASWLIYLQNDQLENVSAISFGARIPFVNMDTSPPVENQQWQFEIQAAAFSIFDMDGQTTDLVNIDFTVAAAISWRKKNTACMARIFHQSSHLGDEFLLANPTVNRENLILNGLDLLYAFDYRQDYRLYGGTGYLFDTNPDSFDPWHIQYGFEYKAPRAFADRWVRPVVAFDCQHRQQTDWDLSFSLVAGVQLENPQHPVRQTRILLEYFKGNSPNGQFYPNTIETLGLGFHVHY